MRETRSATGTALRVFWRRTTIGALVAAATRLDAQSQPVRPLGRVLSTSTVLLRDVAQLIALGDGRVLVQDRQRKSVFLLDAGLANATVVLDSTPGRGNSYATGGALFAYVADSAIFYDRTAKAFLVIAPDGHIGRVMALPFLDPLGAVPTRYALAFSAALGVVYRISISAAYACRPPAVPLDGQPDVTVSCPDSVLVLASKNTATLDTVATIGVGSTSTRTIGPGGRVKRFADGQRNLYPFDDEAVVLPDGSVAIFRAHDFRVDWVNADATYAAGTRLPYEWHRITDADRSRLIDSINTDRTRTFATNVAKWIADSTGGMAMRRNMTFTSEVTGIESSFLVTLSRPPQPKPVAGEEIPDYLPPTAKNAVLADAENNLWIRLVPRSGPTDGEVYQVINRKGQLVERVSVPSGRSIVGFAPGVAFLVAHDAGAVVLEKVSIR